MLAPLAVLPLPARSQDVLACMLLVRALVQRWSWHVAEAMGLALGESRPCRPASIAADRQRVWDGLVHQLVLQRLVRVDGDAAMLLPGSWDNEWLDRELAHVPDCMEPTITLINLAGAGYGAFLRGEIEGEDVILGRDSGRLWQRFFDNGNVHYAPANIVVASFAASQIPGDRLRVLELGGGFGSGCAQIVAALGSRLADYHFTERVPQFLERAQARLARDHPQVPFRFARVDLTRHLSAQGVAEGSVDLVCAVNVLHVVRDLGDALLNIRTALRPGGHLLLGEAMRQRPDLQVPIEFPFMLTRPFRQDVAEPHRTAPGFLHCTDWRNKLAHCGFVDVRIWPEPESILHLDPPYSFTAVHARKP